MLARISAASIEASFRDALPDHRIPGLRGRVDERSHGPVVSDQVRRDLLVKVLPELACAIFREFAIGPQQIPDLLAFHLDDKRIGHFAWRNHTRSQSECPGGTIEPGEKVKTCLFWYEQN